MTGHSPPTPPPSPLSSSLSFWVFFFFFFIISFVSPPPHPRPHHLPFIPLCWAAVAHLLGQQMEGGEPSASLLWPALRFALYSCGKHLNLEFSLGCPLNRRASRLALPLLWWDGKHVCFSGAYRDMFYLTAHAWRLHSSSPSNVCRSGGFGSGVGDASNRAEGDVFLYFRAGV